MTANLPSYFSQETNMMLARPGSEREASDDGIYFVLTKI